MKTLKFTNDDVSKKRFEYLFHGLIIMGNQVTQKGLSVLNREIDLLEKLESVSKPCECGKNVVSSQEPDRELDFDKVESHSFDINDNEFDLLFDYISKVPWSIGSSSREAIKTLNWLKEPNGSKAS